MLEYYKAFKEWRVWLFLGKQDVKSRFRGSVIGPLWLLINQSALMLAVGLIFGHLFHQNMSDFLPFLAIGLVLWSSMTSAIVDGGQTFIIAEGYIKQFTFSKAIYIYRSLVSNLIVFSIGLLVFFFVAISYGKLTFSSLIYFIPGLALFSITNLFTIIIFSHIGAIFKDVPHLFTSLMQMLFYVTPIMYTPEMLHSRGLDFVYKYNPLFYTMEIVRFPLLNGKCADMQIYVFSSLYCAVLAFLSWILVRKYSQKIVYML